LTPASGEHYIALAVKQGALTIPFQKLNNYRSAMVKGIPFYFALDGLEIDLPA
jgi:hypothetical protein